MGYFLSMHIKNANYNLLILIVIPIIFSIANEDWLFGVPAASDNWINYNFFQDFSNEFITENPTYKFSRISVFAVAYPLHQIFSPITAYYIFTFTFFYMAIVDKKSFSSGMISFKATVVRFHVPEFYKKYRTLNALRTGAAKLGDFEPK